MWECKVGSEVGSKVRPVGRYEGKYVLGRQVGWLVGR